MIEIAFIALGVFEFLMVILAWSARKSITRLYLTNTDFNVTISS